SHAYFAQYVAPKGDPLDVEYVPEQMEIERIELDETWIDIVLPELSAFYNQLMEELDNPAHLEPLRVQIDTDEAQTLLNELDAVRARQKADKDREKEIISELVKLAGEKDAEIHGRKLTQVKRAGSIS